MRAARSNDVAPFLPTAKDLERSFHGRILQRGREVMQAGRVSSLELEVVSSNAIELRAQVRGSEQAPGTEQRRYQVGVRMTRKSAGAQVEIESHCSCPIGHLCKHAAAVLLQWQPQWSEAVAPAELPSFARPWTALAETPPEAVPEEPVFQQRIAHGVGTVCVRLGASRAQTPEGTAANAQPPNAALYVSLRIDGVRVPLQRAPSVLVVDGETVDAAPDARQVERVIAQLQAEGATPWSFAVAPQGRRNSESAFQISDDTAVQLMQEGVERWRRQGWEVEVDEDFPWQIVEVDDLEVAVHELPGQDWFDLELGLKLGEKRVPLLPLLESALADVRASAARMREANGSGRVLQVRIDPKHVIRLPWERVAPLLDTLVELGDSRRRKLARPVRTPGARISRAARMLRLSKLDLARVAALADRGALTWVGAPDVRHFAQRLADFAHIEAAVVPQGLQAQLRPYQRAGLNWLQFLREYGLGGLLADDMGLGKTLQTLAHICLEKEQGRLVAPALVIAPTSLVHNWIAEAARFAPALRTLQLHGTERWRDFERVGECDLVVTSFALLARDIEQLAARNFHLLIVDEAQNIKNPRTQAAGAIRQIHATHRLALTGTPLENHLGELWAQFDWLAPGLLGDQASFSRLYRVPIEKRGDDARRQHLTARIRPFVLRRRKDEVAPELPPRTEIERYVALEGGQRDLYEAVRASMHERVRAALADQGLDRSQVVVLDALLKLRQVCCDPRLVALPSARKVPESAKLDLLMQMLDGLLVEGRRVLLFSQFTSMLALIEQALNERGQRYALLTGDTRDRAAAVEQFQSGEVPLFLLSLKAGGTGLNLTAADTVIHYDPWWNPAVEAQATDRAHRIGQDKPVFVYRLLCAGTIEERMRTLQTRKALLAQALLGDEAGLARALGAEDIEALLAPAP
ncbi:MAG TPA: DEAD/DEAH box helicase [Burkholderiaceae bacterium]|nr:DEAD/DEAH box helicase [Burkholderiaceae bacterium]